MMIESRVLCAQSRCHLVCALRAAGALNASLGLLDDPVRIARALVGRLVQVDASSEHKGLDFTIDPAFFMHDLTAHNAESLLKTASRGAHVRLVHSGCGGSCHGAHMPDHMAWGAARAAEVTKSLMESAGDDMLALHPTSLSFPTSGFLPLTTYL